MAPMIKERFDLAIEAEMNVPVHDSKLLNNNNSNNNENNYDMSDSITTTTSSSSSSSSVSFSASVTQYKSIHLNDMTEEEVNATWFEREEMHQMKETVKSEAKQLEDKVLDDDVCVRGLESRTRRGMKLKRRNRVSAYNALFFEIDCQEEEQGCLHDDEAIADAYFAVTDPCQQWAEKVAKKDELEAKKIYDNSSLKDANDETKVVAPLKERTMNTTNKKCVVLKQQQQPSSTTNSHFKGISNISSTKILARAA
jgi:hypothetical protein